MSRAPARRGGRGDRPSKPGVAAARSSVAPLVLRVLGELEVWRGDARVELPQSKKTRALLAYLVLSGRAQRRDRLCNLLWDVADDPRAALRWSLSKLRPLVDEPGARRLETAGDDVRFEPAGARVDLLVARDALRDPSAADAAQLVALAGEFRGPFLEGLEMPDFLEFQSWCLALREECRGLHAGLLATLIERLDGDPAAALPHARALAQLEPFDEAVHARLVRLLRASGKAREGEQHAQAALRLLRQGDPGAGRLLAAEASPRPVDRTPAFPDGDAPRTPTVPQADVDGAGAAAPALVGRSAERALLLAALDATATRGRLHGVLVSGEPGIGKTRLLDELRRDTRRRGGTVLDGRAYEAEASRPYGPWIDALRQLPAVAIGHTLAAELAPLLPELGDGGAEPSRNRLFGAVVELLAARAHSAPPVLLVLDDVQWCDDASAELLHYVARLNRHRPLLLALAGRGGELADNDSMSRVLRSLRHDGTLDEIELGPLDAADTARLITPLVGGADAATTVFAASSGNPLFALEVARSLPRCSAALPPTLRRLVRDRLERLPADAADVLRWAAVAGHDFDGVRLGAVARLDPDRLVEVLEDLERFAMLRAQPSGERRGAYAFAHDIVRQVVYAELSEPRRRLMHQRVVDVLRQAGDDETVVAELAHHAAQAGDADTAARACLRAARGFLRVFAGAEADSIARHGMHHAAALREPARVKLLLELAEVRYGARRPRDPESVSGAVEAHARTALALGCAEHARLGFHLASYLRWEGGDWEDARRHMLRAEEVSRSTDGWERAVALGEAARCLALLERDLGHAEALALEAEGIGLAHDAMPSSVPDAIGMLRLHEGRLDEAAARFAHARALCRREQDRLGEFRTLEHLLMVEMRRAHFAEARELSEEMVDVATRLRDGSEAPHARVLAALCCHALGEDVASELDDALTALRHADAKQRLAWALTRAAEADLRAGRPERAATRAAEALELARPLERTSDVVLALVVRAGAAAASDGAPEAARELAALDPSALRLASEEARSAVLALRRDHPSRRRR
jgi:DNA-binding SARP family transcriptional activator